MLLSTISFVSCGDLDDIIKDIGSNKNEKENESEEPYDHDGPYYFEFTDTDDGNCIITDLRFNPDNTEDIVLEFPSKSPEGKTVVSTNFVSENDVLPRILLAEDYEMIVDRLKNNIEADINSGKIPADMSADERHKLEQFKAYYSRYALNDAFDQEMKDKYLQDYPVLAVVDAVYVLDEANIGYRTIQKFNSFISEYGGLTINDTVSFYEKFITEVNNSNVDNKGQILKTLPSANIVSYPDTVKELRFIDVAFDLKYNVLFGNSVEKVVMSSSNYRTARFGRFENLKYVVTENIYPSIDCCPMIESIELGGTAITEIIPLETQSLKSITIPDSVTLITRRAFEVCINLTTINFTGTEEQWNAIEKSEASIPENITVNYNYNN